jgi:thiol-disulfide isomerase/thioredoxin
MQRFLLTALGVLLLTSALLADKKASPFQALVEEFNEKIETTKGEKEQKVLVKDYSARFLAFAEKNPKAPEAVMALATVVQMGQDAARGVELLLRDHITSPDMKQVVRVLSDRIDEHSTTLLLAIIEKNGTRSVQAQAAKSLVKSREQAVALAKAIEADKDVRKETEEALGKEKVQTILANKDRFEKERAEYLQMLQKKFPDVKVFDLSIGQPAPEISSEDLDGKKVKLSELRGKVVVLDFWATWCPPCKAMIPAESELVKKLEGKPFALVSISADDKKDTLKQFLVKTPMPWTHWFNGPDGGVVEEWDIEYFPTVYVIDHKGTIRYKDVRDKDLEDAVTGLLKELEDSKK